MKIRRFRAGNGLIYPLPLGLKSAPGAQTLRLDDQTVIELDFDDMNVRRHARDIAIALGNGDLVEVTGDASKATTPIAEPAPLPPPPSSPAPFPVNPPAKGADR